MSATGKGRLTGFELADEDLLDPTSTSCIDSPLATITNDYLWGGFPPTPTRIPYSWLTPPARWRSDQPRNVAQVTRTGGSTARATSVASVTAVGERPFAAMLSSPVIADPQAYATWIVGNYTAPRQRMPQLRLNLFSRTAVECWLILEREIGDRISITGAPGEDVQLLSNTGFEMTASPWTAQNGTVAQSALFPRAGTGSLLLTPTGGISVVNALSELVPVAAGSVYATTAWVVSPLGWAGGVTTGVNWFLAGNFVSTIFGTAVPVTAGTMTQLPVEMFTAPAGVDAGQLRIRMSGTPAATDLLYIDEPSVTGPDGTRNPWPDGVTELVIEGIAHSAAGDTRTVTWNTAPVIGASPGVAGPWFRADESRTDTGSDLLAF